MMTMCYAGVITVRGSDVITCGGCKELLPEEAFAIDRMRRTGRRYKCRKCSSLEFARWKETPGYRARLDKQTAQNRALKLADPQRRWAKQAINASRRRAKARGIAFDLTLDWLLEHLPERCPLLGVALVYDNSTSKSDSAALDRFDNAKGYERGNCWVISMLANRIKSNATVEELELLTSNLRLMMDKNMLSAVKAQPALREPTPPRTVVNPYAA